MHRSRASRHAALSSSSSAAFSSLAVDCSAAMASTREKPMSASLVTFSSSVAACERCAKFSAQAQTQEFQHADTHKETSCNSTMASCLSACKNP